MAGGDGRLRYGEVGQLQAGLCQARRCVAKEGQEAVESRWKSTERGEGQNKK